MENFGDRIDYWDVFNEITVDHLYHNAVSRWIHEKGRANAVRYTTKLVREINPHANLLYNDFNIWNQECEVLLEELRYMGVELQAVGIQSHMHTFLWTMEEAWEVCERFCKIWLASSFYRADSFKRAIYWKKWYDERRFQAGGLVPG